MTFVDELKLELPVEFPATEFTALVRRARAILCEPMSDVWQEFAGASNLIGWRFRGAFEAQISYAESWQRYGNAGDIEELYCRDRALFSMFSSGVSCLESTSYAAYALASHPKVLNIVFDETNRRNCSLNSLRKAIADAPFASGLRSAIKEVTDAVEWSTWRDLRNRMTHRSNPPQEIVGNCGGPPPVAMPVQFAATSSTKSFVVDLNGLRELNLWLAKSLQSLLVATTSLGLPA
jgi:hypothetical protein